MAWHAKDMQINDGRGGDGRKADVFMWLVYLCGAGLDTGAVWQRYGDAHGT